MVAIRLRKRTEKLSFQELFLLGEKPWTIWPGQGQKVNKPVCCKTAYSSAEKEILSQPMQPLYMRLLRKINVNDPEALLRKRVFRIIEKTTKD